MSPILNLLFFPSRFLIYLTLVKVINLPIYFLFRQIIIGLQMVTKHETVERYFMATLYVPLLY